MALVIGSFIFVIILGYIFPKSKLIFILETISIIVLVGGYNGDTDLVFYRYSYVNELSPDNFLEGIYTIVAILGHRIGMSFEIFHLVLSTLSIGGIAYVVWKLSPEPAFVMSTMAGFSTFEYAPQVKAMCASSITILAIYYLFCEEFDKADKQKRIIFVLLIIVACGFHFISVFFLSLLLIPYVNKINIKYWVGVGIAIIFVFLPLFKNVAGKYFASLNIYLENYRETKVFLGMCAWQICGVIIILGIKRTLLRKHYFKENCRKKMLANYIYKGSIVMLFTIPFYSLTTVMMRVVRTWSVFYYILASHIRTEKYKVSLLKLIIVLYSIGSLILFYIVLVRNRNNILWDVLSNNLFW